MDGSNRRMGEGTWCISAMFEDTKTPEYRERPTRSQLTDAERGNPDEVLSGKPTVRKADILSGNRMSREAKASRRKARGKPAAN
jgi:hypothetical protein